MFRLKHLLLLGFGFASALASGQGETYVTGQIRNEPNQSIQLIYNKVPFINKPLELRTRTDSNGFFRLNFPLERGACIDFVHGQNSISLMLNPGDSIALLANKPDSLYEYEFSGRGHAETYLNYLNYIKFDKRIIPVLRDTIQNMDPATYEKQVKLWIKECNKVLDANLKAVRADKELSALARNMVRIKEANFYLLYINHYRQLATGEYIPSKSFTDFLANPELFKTDYPKNREFENFLILHLTNLGPVPGADACQSVINYLDYADSLYGKQSKTELMARLLWEGMDNGCYKQMKSWYDAYISWTPNVDYAQALQAKASMMVTLNPGDPAPDFEFVDKDGNTHKLSEFRGKVVYLDFWATWCGPCLQSMRLSEPLKEQFKSNPDVVFVYISTDSDVQRWRNHQVTNTGGPNMWHLGSSAQAASTAYRITTIPRYIIIDKEGKIVDPNAPRPYAPEIAEILLREAAKPYVKQ